MNGRHGLKGEAPQRANSLLQMLAG
jgi:hypothetical protein